MNSQQLELSVWRTLRALIVIVAIVALLFICVFIGNVMDRQLNVLPIARNPAVMSVPNDSGVRVQTYAEIVPGGGQRTANAWAKGAVMHSESVANTNELHAQAHAAWPAGPDAVASNGLAATAAPIAAPIAAPTAVVVVAPSATPSLGLTGAPSFYVTQPLANLRSGPSTEHEIVGTAGAGQRFAIIAQSAALPGQAVGGVWWQVDSGHGLVWIHNGLGTSSGNTQAAPIVSSAPALRGGVVGEVVGEVAAPVVVPTLAPPLQNFPYSVETATRHAEANTVVFYGYVHETGRAIDGKYLWIGHNGATYRSGPSSALIAGTTKPSAPNDPSNVAYNVKIDFPRFLYPGLDMSGEWSIVLVDGNNQALSPVTIISITDQDTQREIYLRLRQVNP